MDFTSVHYLNVFLGTGAIALQAFSVLALFLLFLGPKRNSYLDFIDRHYLKLGFLISLAASLFSLVYSEVIGYAPCYLCWYQRVFIFPLPFIFGAAIWFKERKIVKYVLPLLSVGFLISVYQNFVYYFNPDAGLLPCDASGISCYQQLVSVFGGYISIPMLSLTSFLALLTVVLVAHFYKKED
jgi:disulfide bond formation protein DsbB